MVAEPFEVGAGVRFKGAVDRAAEGRTGGAGGAANLPAVGFEMAIGERETGSTLMERAREVAPFKLMETVHEKTVVERIGMFIDEEESVAGCDEIAAVEELTPSGIELVGKFAGIADEMVESHAAKTRAIVSE